MDEVLTLVCIGLRVLLRAILPVHPEQQNKTVVRPYSVLLLFRYTLQEPSPSLKERQRGARPVRLFSRFQRHPRSALQ